VIIDHDQYATDTDNIKIVGKLFLSLN